MTPDQHRAELANLNAEVARTRTEAIAAQVRAYTRTSPASEKDGTCTCRFYVVDYSDPERYHQENVDREGDPNCPFHGPSDRAQHPGAKPSRTVETGPSCCPGGWALGGHTYWCVNSPEPQDARPGTPAEDPA